MTQTPRTPHGGLNIAGAVAGLSDSDARNLHEHWDTLGQVDYYLQCTVGMSPTQEPEHQCPDVQVEDLTTPDNNTYTETFARVNAWYGYLVEVNAGHEARLLELENEMEDVASSIRNNLRKASTRKTSRGEVKPPNASELSDAVNCDTRYSSLKKQAQEERQKLLRLGSRIEKLDRALRIISRQVEIRKSEFEHTRRSGNVGMGPQGSSRRPYRT